MENSIFSADCSCISLCLIEVRTGEDERRDHAFVLVLSADLNIKFERFFSIQQRLACDIHVIRRGIWRWSQIRLRSVVRIGTLNRWTSSVLSRYNFSPLWFSSPCRDLWSNTTLLSQQLSNVISLHLDRVLRRMLVVLRDFQARLQPCAISGHCESGIPRRVGTCTSQSDASQWSYGHGECLGSCDNRRCTRTS